VCDCWRCICAQPLAAGLARERECDAERKREKGKKGGSEGGDGEIDDI
jgi:hypothetical protein